MLQEPLKPEAGIYFKRLGILLLTHRNKLNEADRMAVSAMLGFSDTFLQVYALKEKFYLFMDSPDSTVTAQRLRTWQRTAVSAKRSSPPSVTAHAAAVPVAA